MENSDRNLVSQNSHLVIWLFLACIFLLCLGGLWWLYLQGGLITAKGSTPTAIIWTPTPTPSPTPTPTATLPPTSMAPIDIAVGHHVIVTDTGGYGLNLREGPGTSYASETVAAEGTIFIIVDGPKAAENFEWWKVQYPEDATKTWWAAGNFLKPID